MNAKNIKKTQEQITEAFKNPQQFVTELNEKNQEFSQQVQNFLLSFPQELLNQQKQLQEKSSVCNSKVQEIVTKTPIDFVQLQQTFLQFHTDNFTTQAKLAQENIKRVQDLFGIYSK